MAPTYELIASNTLGTTAASVTFSSIPATYTDLVVKLSMRLSNGGATDSILDIELNGSSASNYSNTNLRMGDNPAVAASNRYSNNSALRFTYSVNGSLTTADTFNNGELYFPNYTASTDKPMSNFSVLENNAVAAGINAGAGLWRVTDAINEILIYSSSDTIASGSSFFLYGIKNS